MQAVVREALVSGVVEMKLVVKGVVVMKPMLKG